MFNPFSGQFDFKKKNKPAIVNVGTSQQVIQQSSDNADTSSGTYTPTLTVIESVGSVNLMNVAMWMRIGNIVHVALTVRLQEVVPSSFFSYTISLPIPSVITENEALVSGHTTGQEDKVAMGVVSANSDNTARVNQYDPGSTTDTISKVSFTYQII